MNKITKKLSLLIIAFSMALFIPGFAFGDEVEGSVQGFRFVTEGKICPAGKEDPMAAVENVFVVLTTENDYYFVPNLDRAVLASHINDHVRVKGTISSKFAAINADSLETFKGGKWTITWEWNIQKIIEEISGYAPVQ